MNRLVKVTDMIRCLAIVLLPGLPGCFLFEGNSDETDSSPVILNSELNPMRSTLAVGESVRVELVLDVRAANAFDYNVTEELPAELQDALLTRDSEAQTGDTVRLEYTLATTADSPPGQYIIRFSSRVTDVVNQSVGTQDDSLIVSLVPRPVAQTSAIVALDARSSTAAAVDSGGQVYTWGNNGAGLFSSSLQSLSSPSLIEGFADAVEVGVGAQHLVVRHGDGSVSSVGENALGQLGNGTNTTSRTPVDVPAANGATRIVTGGNFTLALMPDGTVRGWGQNDRGQASGNAEDGTMVLTPTTINGLANVTALAAGGTHALALTADGSVWTWGDNGAGQRGDGGATGVPPGQIPGIGGAVAVSASVTSSFALLADGSVLAFGSNFLNALGDGGDEDQPTPVFNSASNVTQLDSNAGGSFSLGVVDDGSVVGWGSGGAGQLGPGATGDQSIALRIAELPQMQRIEAGAAFSLALQTDGTCGVVWSWGSDTSGQLGDGIEDIPRRPKPQPIPTLGNQDCRSLSILPNASVQVTSADASIDCGASCSAFFAPGEILELSASTVPGATFVGFTDDCASADGSPDPTNPLTIVMDRHIQCATSFVSDGLQLVPPVAVISANRPSPVNAGTTVTFSGDSSSDDDGMPVAFEWDFDDDGTPDASGSPVDFTFVDVGSFTTRLTVTDNDGLRGDTTVQTLVTTPGQAPTASFVPVPASPVPLGTTVTFDASSSTDDGTIVSFDWDFDGDGINDDSGQLVSFNYADGGSFDVRLQVRDNDGGVGIAILTLRVNEPPVAGFVFSPAFPTTNQAVSFDGGASSDDVDIAAFDWDFQDDGTFDAAGQTPAFTFTTSGIFDVRLRVTDSDGETAETTASVTVSMPQPMPSLFVQFQGVGVGTITVQPGNTSLPDVSCDGGFCFAGSFPPGTMVTLTATPTPPSTFTGWTLTDCDQIIGNDCIRFVSVDTTVNPTFN